MAEFTTDDGIRLHYGIKGEGPLCVFLLHWMGGETTNWAELVGLLDPLRFRFIVLDQRGHGQSQRERCEFTTGRLARDVLNLADKLGAERFAVVGHSFGGKVALHLTALAPGRVTSLVLIGAVGPGLVPLERPIAEEIIRKAVDIDYIREFYRPWFRVWPRLEIDAAIGTFSCTPAWALLAVCEAALWTDLTSVITGIVVPALVFVGADDPVYGPAYQEAFVRPCVSHARFVTLADCGHGLILERPVEIAAEIGRFLT